MMLKPSLLAMCLVKGGTRISLERYPYSAEKLSLHCKQVCSPNKSWNVEILPLDSDSSTSKLSIRKVGILKSHEVNRYLQ